jgi:hypothetical protein
MKKIHFYLLCFALFGLNIGAAQASLLDFDSVTADPEATIANGYSGLNWSNFWVQDPVSSGVADLESGFYNGVVSGNYSAFNANGGNAEISSSTLFDFNSAYFSAAYRWGLEITATGFRNGSQQYQQQFMVNTDAAQLFTLNFTGIDRLEFVTTGGEAYVGEGFHFTMDNASVTTVPVPATVWLFGSAIAGLIGITRRKA